MCATCHASAPPSTPATPRTAGLSHARVATRSRGSCTRAATPPAPRSSGRSSPRSSATTSTIREGWFALELIVENGRCAGVIALDPTRSHRQRAGHRHRARYRRRRSVLRGHHQPPGVHRRRRRARGEGRCRLRRPRVHAVPPHCAAPPVACPGRSSPRRCAAKAQCCATPTASRSWPTCTRSADLAPRDVVARAIHRERASRRRRRPRVARRHDDRRLRAPLPDDLGTCARGRPRPGDRLAAGGAGRALLVAVACSPISTGPPPSRISGRAARPRAAVCTAPTGSPRTRCSTASCSATCCERDRRGQGGPEPTGAMAGVLSISPDAAARRSAILVLHKRTDRHRRRGAARCRAAHDVHRLRRRARRGRARTRRRRRSPTCRSSRDELPARQIATYEVTQPVASVAGDRPLAAGAVRSREARTRAPTFPTPTTRWLGRFVLRRPSTSVPRFVQLSGSTRCEPDDG